MYRELRQERMPSILERKRFEAREGRLKNYLLLSGTIFVFVILAELVARVLIPAPLQWLWPQTIYEKSPSLGFHLLPNQFSYSADKAVRTNSMGLRGPEIPWQKPVGVRRILLLGDSIAFGYGVRYEDSFGYRLEELLNEPGGTKRYEVINAGVPSFNTIQEVTYLREEGLRLEPDAVILALYWNDISDKLGVKVDSQGRLIDSVASEAPTWSSRWLETKQGYWLRNLTKRSHLLYLVVDRLRFLVFSGRQTAASRHSQMQKAVLTNQADSDVDTGWRSIEGQLRELARLCDMRNIQLLVAILPMPQVLDQEYPNAQYPKVIRELCETHQIDYLDCGPSFKNHYTDHTSLFISYDGDHPNEKGHRLIAQDLYMALSKAASR